MEIITCWVSDHFLEYNSWTIFHPGIAPSSDIRRKAPPKGMEMSPHFPHTLSKASLLLMPYVWHHIRVGFKSSNVSSLVCDKTTNYVHIFVCINISCMLFFFFFRSTRTSWNTLVRPFVRSFVPLQKSPLERYKSSQDHARPLI